jgi:hypothetical protein
MPENGKGVTIVPSHQWADWRRRAGSAGRETSGSALAVSRRGMLAGGLSAGALLAMPDLSLASRTTSRSVSSAATASSGSSATRYVLLYGVQESTTTGGSVAAAMNPAAKASGLPQPKSVAAQLAALPVASPDQSSVALVTVDEVSGGAKVTLTLVNSATAVVEKTGTLTVTGIAKGTNIIATPVFAAGTTTIALVLGVTEPTRKRPAVKTDRATGKKVAFEAVTYVSHHELAYFDTSTGKFDGPFSLGNAPALALHSAAANSSDLFLWTTREPQPGQRKGTAPPLPTLSAFPLGSGQARFRAAAALPWPAHEPVATLPSGDIARFVNGRTVQVASASNGDIAQTTISALSAPLAKPSAVTMTARSDGTVFITKPGAGRAVITDPADSFRVKSQVDFAPPPYPNGGPAAKAVLSASGDTLYVLGGKSQGGLSAYDVATGKLTSSYSQGGHYNGLYLLPNGHLLAVGPTNPRLAFFSPDLGVLGTATTNLQIAAAF